MEPEGTPEERILKAASEVFLEKGIQGARMQEIADRAGINKPMLHYSFRSKEKLLYLILVPFARSLFSTGSDILNSDLTQVDPRQYRRLLRARKEEVLRTVIDSQLP